MIRNIVFDMGGVMREYSPPKMLRQMGVPEEDLPILEQLVFGGPEWIALDRGAVSLEEAVSQMCVHLPKRLWSWAGIVASDWWKYPFEGMPGMAELAGELKGLGYGIYMLSNAAKSLHRYFHRIPGSEHFDGLFVSSDWGLLKPEPAIYAQFLGNFGLEAEECFMVDDSPANVDGARRVGMSAAQYCGDIDRLRWDMKQAGIPVRQTR